MKTKFYVLAALLMASMVNIMADDDVKIKQIYPTSGEWAEFVLNGWDSHAKGLYIDKAQFSDIEVGNAIMLYLYGPGDDPRVYIGGFDPTYHYPGTDFRTGNGELKLYVTEAMKVALQAGDFRLYGKDLKINRVEIWRGKYTIPGEIKFGKTIWTGYFWIDTQEGKTLEVYKEALDGINLDNYYSIRFYHEANRSISINILDTWESDKIADQTTMNMTNEYAELILTDEIKRRLRSLSVDLKIQCFTKDSEERYNFTDVVLMPNSPEGCANCFYVY